jgi:RHS repeat-associated protein
MLTLGYDGAGRVISQTFPDNRVVGFSYDANGNPAGLTPPGRPAHSFAYTSVNLESLYSPPTVIAGTNSTAYAYNLDRELTLLKRPDGETIQYDYSADGCNCARLASLVQSRGTNTYTYDPVTGNLTTLRAADGTLLNRTYDGPLLLSETWSGLVAGSVAVAYDNDFRPVSQNVNGANSIVFQYDTDSLLTRAGSLTLTNNGQNGLLLGGTLGIVADTWSYNGFAEPTNHSATSNGVTIYSAQYIRDAVGRVLGLTEIISGTTIVSLYAYDLTSQLTNVIRNAAVTAGYAYDDNNNRVSLTDPGGTLAATYDNQDRLTQYGTTTYTYTANGELRTRNVGGQTTTYEYDSLGNLVAVALPGGTQIQYLIDGRNRRIGKKMNGILVRGFLYDGPLNCVAELDGTSNVVSRFVYASRDNVPEYLIKAGTTYRFITDHLGSVRLVVNTTTGQIVQRMDYDAFGQVLSDTAPGFQPFGFAGGLYDGDTKLVRFGARDYDAETGRWTAKDPILFAGRQENLYAYVRNNPVNRTDPTGLRGEKNVCKTPPPHRKPSWGDFKRKDYERIWDVKWNQTPQSQRPSDPDLRDLEVQR